MLSAAKNRYITVVIHVLVWGFLVYILFMYPPLVSAQTRLPNAFWIKQTVHTLLLIVAFYFNAYVLVPKLLVRNRYGEFIAAVAAISLFFGFILARIDNWLDLAKQLEQAFGKKLFPNPYMDHFALITMLLVFGISTSITIVQRWSFDAKLRQDFETQRTLAELSFLKAQINPHFFFNTLNSIYALTFVNVDTSRQVLLKLSRMMRYLLYETEQDTTMLSKELAFIKDYVEIMQLRLTENTTVQFHLPEQIEEMPIAPMLLLPFVENAFKHGVDDQQNGTIGIDIKQDDNRIEMNVSNPLLSNHGDSNHHKLEGSGIGLVNTRRRLNLLYRDRHELKIDSNYKDNIYGVSLKINL